MDENQKCESPKRIYEEKKIEKLGRNLFKFKCPRSISFRWKHIKRSSLLTFDRKSE